MATRVRKIFAAFAAAAVPAFLSVRAEVRVFAPSEGDASIATSANWASPEGTGARDIYMINTNVVATLAADESFTTTLPFYVGHGYGVNSEGAWAYSTSFDCGAELEIRGGEMTVENELWIGGSYADFYDSILTVSGGKLWVSSLKMGDCAASAGKQDHPKTSILNLTGGVIAVNDSFNIGTYGKSTNVVNLTGGSLAVEGCVRIGNGGKGVLNLTGTALTPPDEIMIGLGEASIGVMNIDGDQMLKTIHVGRDGGTGILNINSGKTELDNDVWYHTLNLGWNSGSHGYVNIAKGATLEVETGGGRIGSTPKTYGELSNNGTYIDAHTTRIGSEANTTGLVYNAGTFTCSSGLRLGSDNGSTGEFRNLEGGHLSCAGDLRIGAGTNTTGVLSVEAGTVACKWIGIGASDNVFGGNEEQGLPPDLVKLGAQGTLRISGGLVQAEDTVCVGAGVNSTGILEMTGGRLELASGKEFRLCDNSNTTARVYVKGGCIYNENAWFCVGRSNHGDEGNKSYACLEVDGGVVTNKSNGTGNFTIGTLGSSATVSEVVLKSGEIYTDSAIYIAEINPAKLTVSGGTIIADHLHCWLEKGGTFDFRGGTFRALNDTGNYFVGLDDLTLGGNGIAFDTNGKAVSIGNKLVGKLSIVPSEGVLTLLHSENQGCLVAPVITGEGTCTIKVALGSAQTANFSADGLYRLAWNDLGGNTYEVTATREKIVSATWTNGAGDNDLDNPANWSAITESGQTAEALPTADTDVIAPYSDDLPDFSSLGAQSVTILVTGVQAPRGVVAVPEVVKTAKGWYDFDDRGTVTVDGEGYLTALANKGVAGASLDLELHDKENRKPLLKVQAETARSILSLEYSFGLVTKEAAGISGDADRTLVFVDRRIQNRYSHVNGDGEMEFDNQFFPGGLDPEMWNGACGAFRVELNAYGLKYTYGNGPGTSTDLPTSTPADDIAIQIMTAKDKTIAGLWEGRETGVITADSATSAGLDTPAGTKFYVGMRHLWNSPSSGEMCEAMLFDKALTEDEQMAVRDYLRAKWLRGVSDGYRRIQGGTLAFDEGASLDMAGGAYSFASLSGAGTIRNADVTITGKTGYGFTVEGTLIFADGSEVDTAELLTREIGTSVCLFTAQKIVGAPVYPRGQARKLILTTEEHADGTVSVYGRVCGTGFCLILR
ncbi:MAG: hypothetical protein ACI4R9_03095 [Kiritimatiellia bacterium]